MQKCFIQCVILFGLYISVSGCVGTGVVESIEPPAIGQTNTDRLTIKQSKIDQPKNEQSNTEQYLNEYLAAEGFGNFSIIPIGDHDAPDTDTDTDIKEVACNYRINRCRMEMLFIAQEEKPKVLSYWFRVLNLELGWQAINTIEADEAIKLIDLEQKVVDTFACKNNSVKRETIKNQLVAVRRIKRGSAVCMSDVKAVVDVNKGEHVTLLVKSDTFELSIRVKALSSGRIGDMARVRVPGSSRVLLGKIIAIGKVELIQ